MILMKIPIVGYYSFSFNENDNFQITCNIEMEWLQLQNALMNLSLYFMYVYSMQFCSPGTLKNVGKNKVQSIIISTNRNKFLKNTQKKLEIFSDYWKKWTNVCSFGKENWWNCAIGFSLCSEYQQRSFNLHCTTIHLLYTQMTAPFWLIRGLKSRWDVWCMRNEFHSDDSMWKSDSIQFDERCLCYDPFLFVLIYEYVNKYFFSHWMNRCCISVEHESSRESGPNSIRNHLLCRWQLFKSNKFIWISQIRYEKYLRHDHAHVFMLNHSFLPFYFCQII